MTINTIDGVVSALGNNSSRIVIDKASISNTAAAQYHSLWRATGQPGQGAIPATAAVCAHGLAGSVSFTQQTAPATSYGGWANITCSNSTVTIEIHDRLMHQGGLSGIVTTSQSTAVDISANLATSNMAVRKGDANYSDIQWWLEWYSDTGATAANATINVMYHDDTLGNLNTVALAATRRASFMQPLNSFIPAASSAKYIKAINSVTLSVTTGTAGSFGVTATRPRMTLPAIIANKMEVYDWAALGFP